MKLLLSVILLLLCLSGFSQNVILKNPEGVAKPKGYSHAAEIDLGKSKMLIISGQVALDAEGKVVGLNNFEQQADQVFKNIRTIVESSGGTMNDVVKLTFYLRDVSNIVKVREVRDRYVNTATPPASTLVEVSDLFRDEFLLEIEATAVISKK
ncbi:MAG TPA: RidA family protein [Cyclobacteriaceae bacterium]|nr:RidA family protein [Cyclobacteriaceae bacterium]HMV08922.1 RidA family protein [Cyclobacteriaceae bacterium]HMV90448.1 RidA family protein [Cyclobacteriaceae bacterium]HMX00323.1 RidA family protein [Cyclobacteriaceae bacterium]HMX49678.1 RidA family protein [Cyclobacteriaceae bacterium]